MSAPTPLRVRLPFRSEDEFAAHYGAHVGRDGFFLATRAPKPVGAQLLFDLVLADGRSLLRGEGVVVRSSASGERPGMTLRFLRLEAAGKALVERIVSSRTATQAHPSGWEPPAGPSAAPITPTRDGVPAHREAWAPPAGPVRPEPPATSETRPEAEPPQESLLSAPLPEISPAEVSSLEEPPSEVSDTSPADTSPADAFGSEGSPETSESADREVTAAEPEPAPTSELEEPPSEVSDTSVRAAAPEPAAAPEAEAEEAPAETSEASAEAASTPASLGAHDEPNPLLENTSLEIWAAAHARASVPVTPEVPADEVSDTSVEDTSRGAPGHPASFTTAESPTPAAALAAASEQAPEERALPVEVPAPPPVEPPTTSTGPHPPLDDSQLPELVVTEFKGPGPLRPAGLEHTRASADVHAAITPPAGTLVVTELDEPPPATEPRFQLDAPVRGDEPLHPPESSFHEVAQALGQPASVHERPTAPIPLLLSMETAAPDEVPVPPPPPPLDEAPTLEEGAVPIEAGADLPRAEVRELPPAPAAPRPAPSLVRAPEARAGTLPPSSAPEATPTPVRTTPVGTAELGVEIDPESVRVAWFHDGRAEPLVLDTGHGRAEMPVRLVREPGAPPRMLPPDAPEPALWVGAPLPFLGTRAESDASRTVARRWPAAVVPDDRGEAAFALEGGTVGATELVATLLRWVRHRAEELTSHHAGRVVLSVPVAFNTLQRERLREAAERAGFEGVRLVQAPTAATMAFAHGRGLARRRILVWRMGASTCDIAVLAASGDDLDMVACAGDASLGSVNFDEQIALALDKGARADAGVLRRRIAEAAQLRRQLEDASVAEAVLEGGARLTRAELEARTTALVERGVLLAREVLRSASLTPDSLDELVLVGTATRLPHVRRMIEEAMGRTARTDVDAASAASSGAATLAHLLVSAGPKSASRTALHEVLGVPLEIVAQELGQVRVLDRNTRLPAEKTLTVTLGLGTPLEVQVFQGPARAPDPRSFLGLLRAAADRAGDWTLTLSLDTDGVLRASATNPSGKRQPLQLQMPAPSEEAEAAPQPRTPSEPEAPVAPPQPDAGLIGGLKRLFGRR